MSADEPPVGREEMHALQARLRRVEDLLLAQSRAALRRCPSCEEIGPHTEYCTMCGARTPAITYAPAAPTHAVPPAPAPVPPAPAPAPAPRAPAGAGAPATPPAPRATGASAGIEGVLGQRWAPRVGAVLVFLGALFFLGVGIQRGWIGPILQLGLAAAGAAALLAGGAWLTRKRGYGTYPQVLEATGLLVLYVTAFASHALPYYQEATGLSVLGGGILMAAVAGATIALALVRDARVMAGLGYLLGFFTAGVGSDVLPSLTVAYVGILGASLALVVARQRWQAEALVGSFVTGGSLVGFAYDLLPAWQVALASAPPFALFLWLALRPPQDDEDPRSVEALLPAGTTLVTLAWGTGVALGLAPVWDLRAYGLVLLGATALAAGVAGLAARRGAAPSVAVAAAAAALVLYLPVPPLLAADLQHAGLLATGGYALAAVTLALLARAPALARAAPAAVAAAAAYALVAMAWPVLMSGLLHGPWSRSATLVGPWEAWAVLALLAPALAAIVAAARSPTLRPPALALATTFLALWVFALFHAPPLTTAALLAGAAAFAATGLARASAARIGAATALVVVAGLKVGAFDVAARVAPVGVSIAEAVVVAAALLALHHLHRRETLPADIERALAMVTIGGSALMLMTPVFVHAHGAAKSILLGVLGVGYLAAGLALRDRPVYRYTGFAVLGLVLVRLFVVDLREADLAVRALVFVVLGAILLGVGYVYSRLQRKEAAPGAPPPALSEDAPR